MPQKPMAAIVVSVLIIAAGVGWLLNMLHFFPGVDWLWTAGLGVCGVLFLVAGGLNKFTFIVGPFLIFGALLAILRQTGHLSIEVEMPILFIVFGILLLLANLLRLPTPEFLKDDPNDGR